MGTSHEFRGWLPLQRLQAAVLIPVQFRWCDPPYAVALSRDFDESAWITTVPRVTALAGVFPLSLPAKGGHSRKAQSTCGKSRKRMSVVTDPLLKKCWFRTQAAFR